MSGFDIEIHVYIRVCGKVLPSSSGLDKSSYVKANCLASIDKSVFTSKDYLGELNRNDLQSAILKIGEFINSDENSLVFIIFAQFQQK